MSFDKSLLELCIGILKEHQQGDRQHRSTNIITALITAFEGVRARGELRVHYEVMYNQCLVLMVSHFASALAELYRRNIVEALRKEVVKGGSKEEIKIPLTRLVGLESANEEVLGTLIRDSQSISFQDMQSTRKAFEAGFGCVVARDADMDNIIVGQACRHVIVHSGAIVDDKFLRQTREAKLNTLGKRFELDATIQFTPGELAMVEASMLRFLTNIADGVAQRFEASVQAGGAAAGQPAQTA